MLAGHHAVRTAIRLPRDHRHLGHRRFCERKQQLRTVTDDAAVFLPGAGKKSRNVLERYQRNVEGIAEAHESGALHRRIDVERAGKMRRLIRHDPNRTASKTREADDQVAREVPVHLEKRSVVEHRVHEIVHVVRLVGRFGNETIERLVLAVDRIGDLAARRVVDVVPRQISQQLADHPKALAIVGDREVRHAAGRVVRHRTAKFFLGDLFVRDGLDHFRAGHEHVARAFDHDVEVGDGGGVHRTARTRAHDRRNLRNDA